MIFHAFICTVELCCLTYRDSCAVRFKILGAESYCVKLLNQGWNNTALDQNCTHFTKLITSGKNLFDEVTNYEFLWFVDSVFAFFRTQDDLCSPLHVACVNSHYDMAKLLLMNGASIHDEDADGMTPILRLLIPWNLLAIVMRVSCARRQGTTSFPGNEVEAGDFVLVSVCPACEVWSGGERNW